MGQMICVDSGNKRQKKEKKSKGMHLREEGGWGRIRSAGEREGAMWGGGEREREQAPLS